MFFFFKYSPGIVKVASRLISYISLKSFGAFLTKHQSQIYSSNNLVIYPCQYY